MIKSKNYNPNKEIRIKTSMLRSDLCDYYDVYNVVIVLHLKIMHDLLTASQKLVV